MDLHIFFITPLHTYIYTYIQTYIIYLFIHGKTFSIYYYKKFYYNYTVLQDFRVGAQPGATI